MGREVRQAINRGDLLTLEKEVGGELKSQTIIRADTFSSANQATKAAIASAKMMIDQMRDKLFT